MTAKRDLKRRVRERQARTGEHYTTALRHVLAQRPDDPPAVPVLELVDLSVLAAELGLCCRAAMVPALAERVESRRVLERLRDALRATEDDPATSLLRGVALRGERPATELQASLELLTESRRFLARARAGIGGIGAQGRSLAFTVEGRSGPEMVICLLWLAPIPVAADRPPLLIFATSAGVLADIDWEELALR